MKEFLVSGVQFVPRPLDIDHNLSRVESLIERAAKDESDLVVFPESCTTGFAPGIPVEKFYDLLSPIPGKDTDRVAKSAENNGVHVLFPTYERGDAGKIYNSAVMIDDRGEILGVYRKTHPFPTEKRELGGWTTPGDRVVVVRTGFANIGIVICYDGDFPELSRCNALNGAEVILRPSAFLRTFEIWDLTNRAMAYENHVYVVAVNSVGMDAVDNYYFGGSMVVSPVAQKLAQAGAGEDIVYADLTPDANRYMSYGTRSPMAFNHLKDRNVEVYKDILKNLDQRL